MTESKFYLTVVCFCMVLITTVSNALTMHHHNCSLEKDYLFFMERELRHSRSGLAPRKAGDEPVCKRSIQKSVAELRTE